MECVVKPLSPDAEAKGGAALSANTLSQLILSNNDCVSITTDSERYVFARVSEAETAEESTPVVALDRYLRGQLGVQPGDHVEVQPAALPEATEVSVRTADSLYFQGPDSEIGRLVQSRLRNRPVVEGRPFIIELGLEDVDLDQHLPVRPTELKPNGPAIITDETEIVFEQDVYIWSPIGGLSAEGVGYDQIGGLDEELELVREMVELPFEYPELFDRLNIEPPTGVLLHGPPGTGKTLLASAIAEELDAHFMHLDGPEIIGQYRGVAEEALRDTFNEAAKNAPSILFIDEIDAIAPKREGAGTSDMQVVAQLLTLMDGLEATDDLVVIGATNRVDSIDPALRRGGRFDREIEIGIPDETGRREIFDVHTRGVPLSPQVDLDDYAARTHGFVGADLKALVTEAGLNALQRVKPEFEAYDKPLPRSVLDSISITVRDVDQALTEIEPSAMREHAVEVPSVSWSDVGGLPEVKTRLQEVVHWPLKFGEAYRSLDIEPPAGILLHGPPGTGKTLLAKAAANETESNFLVVNGPELMSKWIGESEENVREVFEIARANAPCVLCVDEIDSLTAQRGTTQGDSGVSDRVVSQFLTELDGVDTLENVIVMATTNRPEMIDEALLRPGRLDYQLEVPLPGAESREAIFDVHTRGKPVADDVEFDRLVKQTDGWSGAEIEALCREAAMVAFREIANSVSTDQVETEVAATTIQADHFDEALTLLTNESEMSSR